MAHEIFNNMFIERADRTPAWHKLGQTFEADTTMLPSEAIVMIDGDVPIEAHPLSVVLEDGTRIDTPDNVIVRPAWKEHKAAIFGKVSSTWEVVRYGEVARMFDRATRYYWMETMGVLKEGALFFLTLAGEGFDVLVNRHSDPHDSYIYAAIWSMPGKANIVGAGSTRVVCYNTFQQALHGARQVLPVTHHQGANQVMAFLADSIAKIGSAQAALREAYQNMANTPMSEPEAVEYFGKVWPIPEIPRLVAHIDSMTGNKEVVTGNDDVYAQLSDMLGAVGGQSLVKVEAQPVVITEELQGRRDRAFEVWEDNCERARENRIAALASLGNMADDQGFGINQYTALQAVLETAQYKTGGRGRIAEDTVFGGRAAVMQRAVNIMTGKN